MRGIGHVIRHEANMQVHLACALIATLAGLWLDLDLEQWRWIGLAIALVTSAECCNTAIERACDAIDIEHNALIKQAKDAAAGAVLLAALFAAGIGVTVVLGSLDNG